MLLCPCCDGERRIIAFLADGAVVRKILDHLGIDSEPPFLVPARAFEASVFTRWAGGESRICLVAPWGVRPWGRSSVRGAHGAWNAGQRAGTPRRRQRRAGPATEWGRRGGPGELAGPPSR